MLNDFKDKVAKHRNAIGISLALTVGGCALNPETGERELDPRFDKTVLTTIGAIAITAATGGDKDNILKAGAAGALGGFAWDKIEERFEKLEQKGINVERDGDQIILDIPSDITFDTNQSAIKPGFYYPLNEISAVLNDYPELNIEVVGHTDHTGSDQYNQILSEKRADSVGDYISAQGIAPQRIDAYGVGEQHAVQPKYRPTKAEMADDRRVEIIVNE